MKFAVYQTSKIGGRKYNQDRVAYAFTNDAVLLILADGMGGHSHGEIAAQITIQTFMRVFEQAAREPIAEPADFLRDTTKKCHEAIIDFARLNRLEGSPGTTCVAALIQEGKVTWAHAGDSRFYLLRERKVAGITHDHSVVQQWADWGLITKADMRTHPDRNKITNCLGGVEDLFYVEVSSSLAVQPGDVMLLCSDGFWSPLTDEEIAERLAQGEMSNAVEQLIEMALDREKERADNTTVLAIRLGEDQEEHKTSVPTCIALEPQL